MEGQLVVPFHFAAEFLILAVSVGACLDAVRRARSGGGARALSQAAGFALLAVAQVVHGARIPGAAEDGAAIPLLLRAAGFALVAAGGVTLFAPRRDQAAPVLGIAPVLAAGLFAAGDASRLALVPALAAAAAMVRGAAAHRGDQDPASFAFAAAFASFAGGEVALAFAPADGGTLLAVSHALRFAGALLLVRWLGVTIARSVRLRFVTAFVVALTALVLVLAAAFDVVIARNVEREELRRVGVTAAALSGSIDRQVRSDQQTAFNLGQAAQATVPGRSGLSALACLYPDLDILLSVDAAGRIVGSALKPPRRCDFSNLGAYVAKTPSPEVPQALRLGVAGSLVVVDNALAGRSNAGLEVISPGTLAIVAAAPIGPVARPAGAIAIARIVDAAYLGRLRAGADDLALLVGGAVVAFTGTQDAAAGLQQALDGPAGREVRRDAEEDGDTLGLSVPLGGVRSFASFVPLKRATGEPVAVLAAVSSAGDVLASRESLNRVLFLIALAAAFIAAAIAALAGGHVTRPIRGLRVAAEAIRRGDLSARAPASAPDELGDLGRSFNEMAVSLDRSTADLRAAAITEAELRERMEAIMQSMGDGLVATDAAGRIVTVNRAAETITGLTAAKMTGKRLDAVVRGTAGEQAIADAVAGPAGSFSGVLERGSERVPVAITAAPLRDQSGSEAGRVVVLRDVSAEVQAERMKSEFLSNVSHELRTPLTPIKGYTEILKRKKFSKDKAETFLDGILESTARLERIVEILVDFAAMEAGRLTARTEAVPVKSFVQDAVSRWKDRPGARFTVKVPEGVPSVNADPRLLAKSLDELIDNAVKFSPDGPRVTIEAVPHSNGSRSRKPSGVKIIVRDAGIGIAKDQLPTLFRDFRQIDGSETREYGGLGLGLAYVKRIAAVHGGEVTAQSTPGKGSVFTLLLPAADTERKGKAARTPRAAATSAAKKKAGKQ
ncbi:MAG TPA: ATP-binding protein [Actinomycetota bacterium]|nr:ATP-binding protein [Actinomycetota bacterium]